MRTRYILTRQMKEHPITRVSPVTDPDGVARLQAAVADVHVDESLKDYIVRVVEATRTHPAASWGQSAWLPRPDACVAGIRCHRGAQLPHPR